MWALPLSSKEQRGMGIAGGIYSPGGGGAVRGMGTNKGAAMRRGMPEKGDRKKIEKKIIKKMSLPDSNPQKI